MKKKILSIAAVVPTLCFTSACSIAKIDKNANIDQWYNESTGEIDITEEVDIDWWTWGGKAAEEIFTNIANTFSTVVCPNIHVHYTCLPSSSYLNTLANSSNDLPDLFFMPDTDFYQYAYNGVVFDFSKYITQAEINDVWVCRFKKVAFRCCVKL